MEGPAFLMLFKISSYITFLCNLVNEGVACKGVQRKEDCHNMKKLCYREISVMLSEWLARSELVQYSCPWQR